MSKPTCIFWFQRDLRLSDNPALSEAAKFGTVVPIFILDDSLAGKWKSGASSHWWLQKSLESLNKSLSGKLGIFSGKASMIIPSLAKKHKAEAVFWNDCVEPWRVKEQNAVIRKLKGLKIQSCQFNGTLLWDPKEIVKKDGTFYKVFTPFFKKGCLGSELPRKPLQRPSRLLTIKASGSKTISSLNLSVKDEKFSGFSKLWNPGESGASGKLKSFLSKAISHYDSGRNLPGKPYTSRLSPHLHFGEVSPNQVWYAVKKKGASKNVSTFLSELGWREFSHNLLFHFPALPNKNFQSKFDKFSWKSSYSRLKAWQEGKTGYPIVDAGMRELWQTGYMHNRVRMIVASFLTKNLLQHWHKGQDWFWQNLVDADLPNNSFNWQWVAGSGADAAPYFRIFNPVLQGEKFDPKGEYTRKFVPELKKLPDRYLYKPWLASDAVLEAAGVTLGKTYPKPIVDLDESRKLALLVYKKAK